MQKKIKCVIFDLDNTIWSGNILEDNIENLKPNVFHIIKELDKRGILLSIVSKGFESISLLKLKEFGILDYFVSIIINWNKKSQSIQEISKFLNISTENIAFIDDEKYELEEVAFNLPSILCINTKNINKILNLSRFNYDIYTEESGKRREYYLAEIKYRDDQKKYGDNKNDFLRSLNMNVCIDYVHDKKINRIIELIDRSNKLNSIGHTINNQDVNTLINISKYDFLYITYSDKFCDYGIIGTILIEKGNKYNRIKFIVFSCRIISRDISTYILSYIINEYKEVNKQFYVDYINTGYNLLVELMLKKIGFVRNQLEAEFTYKLNIFDKDLPDFINFSFQKNTKEGHW